MLSYFIIAISVISTLYLIYEGIIAPSLRMDLRYKLFGLRDDLRLLKIQEPHTLNNELYEMLENSINVQIKLIPKINISTLIEAQKILQDDGFVEKIKYKNKLIEECENEKIRMIEKESSDIFLRSLGINSFGWAIYLIPIVLSIIFYKKITKELSAIRLIPESKIQNIVGHEYMFAN